MITKLTFLHKADFVRMNRQTAAGLADPAFLIPFSDSEIETVFKPDAPDLIYGVFEAGELIAMSGLYFNLDDFKDEPELQALDFSKTAEIGGSMTSPAHRNKGFMYKLNSALIRAARRQGITTILATAHPENNFSNRSLQRMGMRIVKEFDRHGYRRNLYRMDLEQFVNSSDSEA